MARRLYTRSVRAWGLVAGLFIAAFVARAPLYLSVLPPFEAWDEIQHLAYIAYLDDTGAMPVLDEAIVPRHLRPLFVSVPHSQSGADQLRDWGGRTYADYWKSGPPADAHREAEFSFRLVQAQQPPLAYVVSLPAWRALKAPAPLNALHLIRAANVVLAAAAIALFAAALPSLVPSFWPRVAVLALVCLHPLFFQNVARVANDALAVSTGLAGFSLLVLARGRVWPVLLAAACLAASLWTKQTSLTLLPAFALGVPLHAWAHHAAARRVWLVTLGAGLALLVLIAPLWIWTYQQYGVLLSTHDSIELAGRGSVAAALATSFRNIAWWPVIENLFIPGRAWVGGWSFLATHETLAALYGAAWTAALAAATAGGVFALRRARTAERETVAGLALCALIVAGTVLGMVYYTVVSNAAYGRWMTNPWYFMAALPFLFVLLVRGLNAVNARLAAVATMTLLALFVAIELYGTWVRMPEFYASTAAADLQWSRLSAIHPAALSGDRRWVFLTLHLGTLGLAAGAAVAIRRRSARTGIRG